MLDPAYLPDPKSLPGLEVVHRHILTAQKMRAHTIYSPLYWPQEFGCSNAWQRELQELRMAARKRMTALRRVRMMVHSSRARRECAAGGARGRSATAALP